MADDELYIDYPHMIDEAMRTVVQKSLIQVRDSGGLPGDHHFFISFDTTHPGVKISSAIKQKYPTEMTIVLQHQFWDLEVDDKQFSVTLSFSGVPERMIIPFQAMTAFADPSIKFGLQFHLSDDDFDEGEAPLPFEDAPGNDEGRDMTKDQRPVADVISIDSFRKK